MAATAQDPGLRQRPFLAGISLVRGTESIQEIPQRANTAERMADSFTVVDGPYLPLTNPPDGVVKCQWRTSFPRIGSPDYRAFARAEALPGFMDFCLWKPISEMFSGTGSATVFTLLRRNALTQIPSGALPANAATIYAVKAYVNDSVVTTPTFGTPDARTGVTQVTFGSAPAAGSSNVEIHYVPLYYVRIDALERDFPVGHRETRNITFMEI